MKAGLVVHITPDDVGRRVSVRSRIPEGVPGGYATTDVVGHLLSWSGGALQVRRRDETVAVVAEDDLLAGKVLADEPPRSRGPRGPRGPRPGGYPSTADKTAEGGTPMEVTTPTRPQQRVAPETHPVELRRLAFEEATSELCRPLNVQALVWLFRAFNATLNAQTEELRPLGLSPSAFNVLMALHNTDDRTLEPCQLAVRLLISRPSVTGLLDTLQNKGLIERLPHADDRRRVLVRLTDQGLALLETHYETHYSEVNDVFGDLSDDEKSTLVSLLRRVRNAVPPDFTDPQDHAADG